MVMLVCVSLYGSGGWGERWGLFSHPPTPIPPLEPALAARQLKTNCWREEKLSDESFGFVQSLPRIEGKCILTYVLFLGKGVWI